MKKPINQIIKRVPLQNLYKIFCEMVYKQHLVRIAIAGLPLNESNVRQAIESEAWAYSKLTGCNQTRLTNYFVKWFDKQRALAAQPIGRINEIKKDNDPVPSNSDRSKATVRLRKGAAKGRVKHQND